MTANIFKDQVILGFCISCCNEIFPFGILTNKNFLSTISNCNPTTIKNSDANHISSSSSLALKPSANLSLLFNYFNNFSPEPKNEPENVVNSNYYEIDQIQTLKFPEKICRCPYFTQMHAH